MFMSPVDLRLKLRDEDRDRLKVMFLAKHARGDGSLHPVDGGHATYHHELRGVMEGLFPDLTVADRYEDLFPAPDFDYLFTLLNRGGFKNSEVLAPALATWRGTPFLGASPALRILGDDKHLMKLCARARGVPTPDSEIYRFGGGGPRTHVFPSERLVVKPNASSASWGVKVVESWADAAAHMDWLFANGGHDVLVEQFVEGIELAVPVIGDANGAPVRLPVMKYTSADNDRLRTYAEKRGLAPSDEGFAPFDDPELCDLVTGEVEKMLCEVWPFDYGRFEFKVDPKTMRAEFLELNMSCNLWSEKTMSKSWRSLGYRHEELVETIAVHSMLRQGVISRAGAPS